jgi:hypothetical protein
MGFFSFECKGCGHSILSAYSVDKGENEWMKDCVAVGEDGEVLKGEYDGYGRVGPYEDESYDNKAFYHRHCWELLGKPTEFDGPSDHAEDQGYFFDPWDHMIPKFETLGAMAFEKQRMAFVKATRHKDRKEKDERYERIDNDPKSGVAKIRFIQEVEVKHQNGYDAENIARNVMVRLTPTTNGTIIKRDYGRDGNERFEVLSETPEKWDD